MKQCLDRIPSVTVLSHAIQAIFRRIQTPHSNKQMMQSMERGHVPNEPPDGPAHAAWHCLETRSRRRGGEVVVMTVWIWGKCGIMSLWGVSGPVEQRSRVFNRAGFLYICPDPIATYPKSVSFFSSPWNGKTSLL